MYELHKEIIDGMCVEFRDGLVFMCDKVAHRSGQIDAVPAQVLQHPAGYVCESYAFPWGRKKIGGCALCSIPKRGSEKKKHKLNPIKASKRN